MACPTKPRAPLSTLHGARRRSRRRLGADLCVRRLAALALALLPAACSEQPDTAAASASAVAAGARSAEAEGNGLSGVIELQPGLDIDVAAFDSVFLLVRKQPGGPLDYVRKLADPGFPQAFTITEAHSMQGGAGMSGAYQIVARLDRDGDAAAQVGDVQGIAAEPAVPGGPPVHIVLNQVLTGSGEAPHAAGATAAHAGATSPHAGLADAPREAGPRFVGSVALAPQFAGRDGTGTLYIIVRSATSGGAPLAVIRRTAPHFPNGFDIGPEHVTLQGLDNKLEVLQGDVKLYARLSLSGLATASPGDLESAPLILEADGPAVTLVLDTLKP